MKEQDAAVTRVIANLNELARELLELRATQANLKAEFAAEEARRKQAFEMRHDDLVSRIQTLKRQIRELITKHRTSLIKSGKKSFATLVATYSYRNASTKFKITDKSGVVGVGRNKGILRKICKISVVYTPNAQKLEKWLDTHPEDRDAFEPFIVYGSAGESLSLKPNESYLVQHGKDRISNESINLMDD